MDLAEITDTLAKDTGRLRFGPPVRYVYKPLDYARGPYELYIQRFGQATRDVLLVGMNPGPWGMAQTGVPFGDVSSVRDWLGIQAAVGTPTEEHPKRKVLGFACPRGEVSGNRLWGWVRETFVTPKRFFKQFFVANYCPLVFLEQTGRNRTPDRLPARERERLLAACDRALRQTVDYFQPRYVVGVGAFAASRIRAALVRYDVTVGKILHPSPASPRANRGWASIASAQLSELGIRLPVVRG